MTKRCTSLDYFLTFCEYIYNFAMELHELNVKDREAQNRVNHIIENVRECMDILGYEEVVRDDIISVFVERKRSNKAF